MSNSPARYHRKTIRLKGWDYSSPGAYYVTLCVQNRECLFGKVINGEMQLNDAGNMVEKWYFELANKFPTVFCDDHITMPNHFHAIIVITQVSVPLAGADLRVCPSMENEKRHGGEHAGTPHGGEHAGTPQREVAIPGVMQWFKTMTTNEYIRNVKTNNWAVFNGKLWQRSYYDHIGRNEKDLFRIRRYIRDNPLNWDTDNEKPLDKKSRFVALPDSSKRGALFYPPSRCNTSL